MEVQRDNDGYCAKTQDGEDIGASLTDTTEALTVSCPDDELPALIRMLAGMAGLEPGHYYFETTADPESGIVKLAELNRAGGFEADLPDTAAEAVVVRLPKVPRRGVPVPREVINAAFASMDG